MSKQQNMAMVLQAFKNAGLSDNQARMLAAEAGREHAFQDRYLWGTHADPKNKVTNIGLISWQGARARGVEQALRSAGLMKGNTIIKGQASLDVMAKYLVNEIRTNPTYAQTKRQFLDNPNVDYHTGTRVLGRNFIRWRYDDPKYASGHRNRDKFYRELGGIVPAAGAATQGTQSTQTSDTQAQTTPTTSTFQLLPTPEIPQMPVDLFGGMGGQNVLGVNMDLMSILSGMGATGQQGATPMLPQLFS